MMPGLAGQDETMAMSTIQKKVWGKIRPKLEKEYKLRHIPDLKEIRIQIGTREIGIDDAGRIDLYHQECPCNIYDSGWRADDANIDISRAIGFLNRAKLPDEY